MIVLLYDISYWIYTPLKLNQQNIKRPEEKF